MNTQLTVKNIQHSAWAAMVQQQIQSGLSVREWCEQNDITTKTFYYRRKQIREELLVSSINKPVFAEVVPPSPGICRISEKPFNPQLVVTVNDVMIGVDQETPVLLFKEILSVIRNA